MWFLAALFGVGRIVTMAWGLFMSLPPFLRQTIILLLAVIAVYMFAYSKGGLEGRHVIQARWDAAEQAAIAKGSSARDSAEASVPPLEPEVAPGAVTGVPAPRPSPCRVPNNYDRDCRK